MAHRRRGRGRRFAVAGVVVACSTSVAGCDFGCGSSDSPYRPVPADELRTVTENLDEARSSLDLQKPNCVRARLALTIASTTVQGWGYNPARQSREQRAIEGLRARYRERCASADRTPDGATSPGTSTPPGSSTSPRTTTSPGRTTTTSAPTGTTTETTAPPSETTTTDEVPPPTSTEGAPDAGVPGSGDPGSSP